MPEAAPATPPRLERVGKYDVVEVIADGGFATLYKGTDPFLKRVVAIKVCASRDPELRAQFLNEAEIAGKLDHPNIVRTFDFGFESGGPYMVQEYLHGEDLWRKIERRAPLSQRQKLGLIVQVAHGLAYSHGLGVLHLDVKPANVRVLENGQAKLLDYGIARLAHDASEPKAAGMMGTAGYLPPEQVRGESVDARADVFAFGALAYELFTYERPFEGRTIPDLLKNVLAGKVRPVVEFWPECPPPLARLIHRCLSKDREARYARFEEILPELVALLGELPVEEGDSGWAAVPALTGVAPESATAAVAVGRPPPRRASEVVEALAAKIAARTATALEAAVRVPAVKVAVGAIRAGVMRRHTRWAAATVLAALVAAIGMALVVRSGAEPQAQAQGLVPDAVTSITETSPGVLLVSAVPWGEVVRIREEGGAEVDLPPNRTTPLRLWLAPGNYDVAVTGPDGGEPWTCNTQVAPGATHICHAALAEISVTRYFKDMGWWQ